MCKFDMSWGGICKKEPDKDFCEEHLGKKCGICGKQATSICGETSFLVCGFPTCDSCQHAHAISHKRGW